MRDSVMEDQDERRIRKSECEELGLEANTKAVLEDVGHNADLYLYLYIANQEDHLLSYHGTVQSFVQRQSTKL